jgi:ABC-2 type transport system permease protein
MTRSIHAELRKLRTLRTTTSVVLGAVAVALLLGAANAAVAGSEGSPALGSAAFVDNVLGVSAIPAATALLLGVLLAAGEHQHGTITTTFLVTPRRRRVVTAKVAAAALAGPALAVVMAAAAAVATVPAVVSEGASVSVGSGAATTLVGLMAASSLLGGLGALLGLLVRSQVAAVVLVAGWALVAEGIIDIVTGSALRDWLPGAAAADLAGGGTRGQLVPAAVLAAWLVAAAVVSTTAVERRDVA